MLLLKCFLVGHKLSRPLVNLILELGHTHMELGHTWNHLYMYVSCYVLFYYYYCCCCCCYYFYPYNHNDKLVHLSPNSPT